MDPNRKVILTTVVATLTAFLVASLAFGGILRSIDSNTADVLEDVPYKVLRPTGGMSILSSSDKVGAVYDIQYAKPTTTSNGTTLENLTLKPFKSNSGKKRPSGNPAPLLTDCSSDNAFSSECFKLDIFGPIRADNAPVFVFVHGGTARMGDKNQLLGPGKPLIYSNLGDAMARHGIITVNVNYPLYTGENGGILTRSRLDCGKHVKLIDELRAIAYALAWTENHIDKFGGNPNHIVLGGQSAGGMLSAQLAQRANTHLRDDGPNVFDVFNITGVNNGGDLSGLLLISPEPGLRIEPKKEDSLDSFRTEQWQWRNENGDWRDYTYTKTKNINGDEPPTQIFHMRGEFVKPKIAKLLPSSLRIEKYQEKRKENIKKYVQSLNSKGVQAAASRLDSIYGTPEPFGQHVLQPMMWGTRLHWFGPVKEDSGIRIMERRMAHFIAKPDNSTLSGEPVKSQSHSSRTGKLIASTASMMEVGPYYLLNLLLSALFTAPAELYIATIFIWCVTIVLGVYLLKRE